LHNSTGSTLTTGTRPVAVIDIGATSLRMAIAEINPHGQVHLLESLSQAVSLGKDSFIKGRLDKATIEDCVRVLKIYREKLREYRITRRDQIRLVATSAVREAANQLAFLDRVFIATGFEIEPFDEAELHRVTYRSVAPFLELSPVAPETTQIICEVGGGSTEVLAMRNSNVMYSQTFRLGALRIRKTLEALDAPVVKVRDIIESQIDQVVQQVFSSLSGWGEIRFVAIGGDLRFALTQLLPMANTERLVKLSLSHLEAFTNHILKLTPDRLFQRYRLSLPDAETLGPALAAYVRIAQGLKVDAIYVANANVRDGLLHEMAHQDAWSSSFNQQVTGFALQLCEKFHVALPHAKHVAEISRKLFAAVQISLGLEPKTGLLLYTAALLHEIGNYVSNRAYHKHSMYLIRNSEMFGLSKRELLLTSLVARYHRRSHPSPMHEGFGELDRQDRITVTKLASLLRIAKSLDESRSQRIKDFDCQINDNQLIISVANVPDLTLEQISLRQSAALFEETFGSQVVLTHHQD
jgi:exopolyphosphatase / guanosine-5'-triphosphate,3'-diphosphate pyrophosphatase